MVKRLIVCSLIGGLVWWVWGFVMHVAIPLYTMTIHTFPNEAQVQAAIMASNPDSGMYYIPGWGHEPGMTKEQQKAAEAAMMEKMKRGPRMFIALKREGMSFWPYLCTLSSEILGVFVVTLMIFKARLARYWSRVCFFSMFGLAAWIAAPLLDWIWMGFSRGYSLTMLLDMVVAFTLIGLAVGKWAGPAHPAA